MNSLEIEIQLAKAKHVSITEDTMSVDLSDGRTISVPLAWFPRLVHGTQNERERWRLIGQGEGIHWPDLDEDVSVANLILGKPSSENNRSLNRWLEERAKRNQ